MSATHGVLCETACVVTVVVATEARDLLQRIKPQPFAFESSYWYCSG